METKTPFWRLLAAVSFLVLFFPGPAACQEAAKMTAGDGVTQIDYSKNHGSFPNIFSPYFARYVPAPAFGQLAAAR